MVNWLPFSCASAIQRKKGELEGLPNAAQTLFTGNDVSTSVYKDASSGASVSIFSTTLDVASTKASSLKCGSKVKSLNLSNPKASKLVEIGFVGVDSFWRASIDPKIFSYPTIYPKSDQRMLVER